MIRQVVVMFGGSDPSWPNAALGDTWEWNGTNWTQRTAAPSPPPRGRHSLDFDTARGTTVLFGGGDFSDTWEWNGSSWSFRLAQHPSPRSANGWVAPGMVFDTTRNRVVLVSGSSPVARLWEWDGSLWAERVAATNPPGRPDAGIAYDSRRGRLVMFGGIGVVDTWEWDGSTWTQMQPASSPPARSGRTMAFDSRRGLAVLNCGNYLAAVETWEWDGITWNHVPTATGPLGPARVLESAFDTARDRVILLTDGGAGGGPLQTWLWDGTT